MKTGVAIGKIKNKKIESMTAEVDEDYQTRSSDEFVFTDFEDIDRYDNSHIESGSSDR